MYKQSKRPRPQIKSKLNQSSKGKASQTKLTQAIGKTQRRGKHKQPTKQFDPQELSREGLSKFL